MQVAAEQLVFSLPLQRHWDTQTSVDLANCSRSIFGLSRFVGDQSNASLNYFNHCEALNPSDWPIVLHGASGTGKTSLATALLDRFISVGDRQTERDPVIISAADFVRRFRSAIETDSVTEFRNRFANGMLIDDLQYIEDYVGSQHELCFLIDHLLEKQRPIIATTTTPPTLSTKLLPQLSSRLSSGLCLPIVQPGESARRVILQDLAAVHDLDLEPEALDWLVHRLNVAVPRINHVLLNLKSTIAGNHESNTPISVAFLQAWFEKVTGKSVPAINEIVLKLIAAEFGFKTSELKNQSRKQTLTLARSVAMYFCRELAGLSYLKIGQLFGNRDHSTVMHSCRKIKKLIETTPPSSDAKLISVLHRKLSERIDEFNIDAVEKLLNTSQ